MHPGFFKLSLMLVLFIVFICFITIPPFVKFRYDYIIISCLNKAFYRFIPSIPDSEPIPKANAVLTTSLIPIAASPPPTTLTRYKTNI